MSKLLDKDFKIVEKHKIWFSISIAVILLGIIMFTSFAISGKSFGKGLNLGIDFTGGTQLEIEIGSDMTAENQEDIKDVILSALDEFGITDRNEIQHITGGNEGYTIVYRADNEKNNLITRGVRGDDNNYTSSKTLSLKGRLIEKIYNVTVTDPTIEDNYSFIKVNPQTVTAKASSSLVFSALLAVLVASVLILIYIAIRFELSSGVVAVIALIHDVIIMIAFMAIVRMQINSTFIAALITIIGYSINNTIVIFDRIRENARRSSMANSSATAIVNQSIKDTLTRTIYTTVTTMITIVLLFILGVTSIREFALPIIIGLVAGTFSSIFISTSMWALFKDWQTKKKGKSDYFSKKLFKKSLKNAEVKNEIDE